MKTTALVCVASIALAACNAVSPGPSVGAQRVALDNVTDPPANTSLLVLAPGADRAHLVATIEHELRGVVYHEQGTRLLVVRVPENADAALGQLGVAQRFERAIADGEIAALTIEEARFVRVFNNRYYPVAAPARFAVTRRALDPSQPFEEAPRALAAGASAFDTVTTPYASGTVVVAIVMPESNGVAEPSTEDWTEDAIVATYQKIQTALEAIERTEPNAGLRFVLHYESAPANGGLPGTVDCDFEFGQHAGTSGGDTGGTSESVVSQQLYERILGHSVANDLEGAYEYVNKLREQYRAEGAYIIKVSPDLNGTAAFRAHAVINGPWTSLTTDYGFETFMHETGHIFGALDEYCPDACIPPTVQSGYLGAIDANSAGTPGGFSAGMGENQSSLMQGNVPGSVNGYTRAAWGWADSDGDGVIEVRDTSPRIDVKPIVDATGSVTLSGVAFDFPATPWFVAARSFNHIAAVEWRFADMPGDGWFVAPLDVPSQSLTGDATSVDVPIGALPFGTHHLLVRSRNTIGNTDPAPLALAISVTSHSGDTAPRIALAASPSAGSPRTAFALTATADDRDPHDAITVRFDLDGDGVYDTPFGSARTAVASHLTPGVHHLHAQVKDHANKTAVATCDVVVLDADAPPAVDIAGASSEIFATTGMPPLSAVGADPDGDAIDYDWVVESATDDRPFTFDTGFGAGPSFQPSLPTPEGLLTTPVRLGRIGLGAGPVITPTPNAAQRTLPLSPTVMATAYGREGVYFTDLTDFANPQPLLRLALETDARDLALVGNTLFVLGESLAAVDVSDPRSPKEILQRTSVKSSAQDTQAASEPIPDGDASTGVVHVHAVAPGKLADLTVTFVIDHPAPAELRLTLDYLDAFNTPREIVLRDQVAGPAGVQSYTFSSANGGPLAALVGLVAVGSVELHAMDVAGGNTGTLISTTASSNTVTRAYRPLAGAAALPGSVGGGRYLPIAGRGVEVVDTSKLDALAGVSSVSGTGLYGAVVSGQNVIVLSPLDVKGAPPGAPAPATKGLYALSLAAPKKPAIVRIDPIAAEGAGLFLVGDRMYFNQAGGGGKGGGATPVIASASAFVAGGAYAIGQMPAEVGGTVFGDDSFVWTLTNGLVSGYDVHDPKAPVLMTQFFRPSPSLLQPLGGLRVALAEQRSLFVATLDHFEHPISRVYRVTLQARDASGLVGTATRTIHVQPYDRAPRIDALALTSGQRAGDTFTVQVTANDPDAGLSWDPVLAVRADLDGDGYFETGWQQVTAGAPATLSLVIATPGARTAHVQVRDTYGAVADATLPIDVE